MSHPISSSDSEDDSNEAAENLQQRCESRVSKFECPAEFVATEYSPSVISHIKDEHTELWLIKAPASFDPNSLAGLKVPLSGLETIKSAGPSSQIYSVLGSQSGCNDFHLLTSTSKNKTPSTSPFAGVLSICENYGDCSGNQEPIAIPAAPAPCIPPGLRQRFQPFGSSTVARVTSTSIAENDSEQSKGQRKAKKKKKKEKRNREETAEVMHVKKEEINDFGELHVPGAVQEDGYLDRKLKKKIKKEKERAERQEDGGMLAHNTSLTVKQEPMDTSYSEIDGSCKKKKKKKKRVDE